MSTVDRLSGSLSSVAIKAPVRCATLAPIALSGLQSIDGVALAVGDRVLVKDQANAAENGIWIARSSGWFRAPDFNGSRDAVTGTQLVVNAGAAQENFRYKVASADPILIGTSAIAFEQISDGPQGPVGAIGPVGPQGPAGPAGQNGTTTVTGGLIGPVSSTIGNIATWNDTIGGTTADGGVAVSNVPTLSGQNVFTGVSQTVSSNAAGSAAGPHLVLFRNNNRANGDAGGMIKFSGKNAGGNNIDFAEIYAHAATATNGAEYGAVHLRSIQNGAEGDRLHYGAGLWMEGATGGDPGVGKINATELQINGVAVATAGALPAGHIHGLILANGTDASNDIDIATGAARSASNTGDIILETALTKQLDAAWVVGSGNGGIESGSKAANTTYHLHVIKRSDTGVEDAIFSLSHDRRATVTMTIASPCVVSWPGHGLVAGSTFRFSTTGALPTGVSAGTAYFVVATGLTADSFRLAGTAGGSAINTSGSQSGGHTGQALPILPANYDLFRRIGSIKTSGASAILGFVQDGDLFRWKTRITASVTDTSSRTSTAINIPAGLRFEAIFDAKMTETPSDNFSSPRYVVFFSPDENAINADTSPSLMAYPIASTIVSDEAHVLSNWHLGTAGRFEVVTNTSAQIDYRTDGTSNPSIQLTTIGWRDRRGRHVI